jgi:hypothetical protein
MDVKKAAENTLIIWHKKASIPIQDAPSPLIFDGEAKQSEHGVGLMHQRWLLEQVSEGIITGDKAHRWLGYAQGFLVRDGVLTMAECRFANLLS